MWQQVVVRDGMMRPAEFWSMRPAELRWLIEAKLPAKKYAGGLTEAEVAERYQATYGEDDGND